MCWPAMGGAAPGVQMVFDDLSADLGPAFSVLLDEENELTFEEVSAEGLNDRWVAGTGAAPNYGYSNSTHWHRVSIQLPEDRASNYLIEIDFAHIDEVNAYFVEDGQLTDTQKSGLLTPLGERRISHRNILFRLPLMLSDHLDVYISTRGENAIQVPARLWREDAFWAKERHVQFFIALCIGAMLAMIIYNLFVYQATKDPLHLSFAQMTTSVGLAIATTYQVTYEYLWPDWPWFANRTVALFIAFTGLTTLSFIRSYLELASYSEKFEKVFKGLSIYFLVGLVLPFVVSHRFAATPALVMALVTIILVVVCAVRMAAGGDKRARLLLIAFGTLFGGAGLTLAGTRGLLPANILTQYGALPGATAFMVLIGFAVGERLNELKQSG